VRGRLARSQGRRAGPAIGSRHHWRAGGRAPPRGLARPAQRTRAPDCEKTYLAEVVGCFPDVGAGEKDFVSPGARPGTLSVAVPIGRVGRRGSRVKLGGGRQPLPAVTEFALVGTKNPRPHSLSATLARVEPTRCVRTWPISACRSWVTPPMRHHLRMRSLQRSCICTPPPSSSNTHDWPASAHRSAPSRLGLSNSVISPLPSVFSTSAPTTTGPQPARCPYSNPTRTGRGWSPPQVQSSIEREQFIRRAKSLGPFCQVRLPSSKPQTSRGVGPRRKASGLMRGLGMARGRKTDSGANRLARKS